MEKTISVLQTKTQWLMKILITKWRKSRVAFNLVVFQQKLCKFIDSFVHNSTRIDPKVDSFKMIAITVGTIGVQNKNWTFIIKQFVKQRPKSHVVSIHVPDHQKFSKYVDPFVPNWGLIVPKNSTVLDWSLLG